jgi:hypothetical protein
VTSANAAPSFDERGRLLWAELTAQGPLEGGARVLAEEACRTADRLDKLDRLLTGSAEDWIDLRDLRGHEGVVEIVINNALSEARQQALALKQILTELRQQRGVAQSATQGGDPLDELASRRAARIAGATGS